MLVLLGVVAILVAFPQIALFLPNLMMGGQVINEDNN